MNAEIEKTNFIGGFPRSLFQKQGEGKLRTESGYPFGYRFSDTVFLLNSRDSSAKFAAAAVNLAGFLGRRPKAAINAINFGIETRNWQGDPNKRHPDMRAAQLFAESIHYFTKINKLPIQYLIGEWLPDHYPPSDNYIEYTNYLDNLQRKPTRRDKVAAALHTWTGRQAVANGYKYVSSITGDHEGPNSKIIVVFSKSRIAAIIDRLNFHFKRK